MSSEQTSIEEHVFEEPWHAQSLAMAERLKEAGVFSAAQWAAALGAERAAQAAQGAADAPGAYYLAVLAALEALTEAHAGLTAAARDQRRNEWRRAYLHTAHGAPVLLSAGQQAPDPAGD